MGEERPVLICMDVGWIRDRSLLVNTTSCEECGCEVGLAQSGIDLIAERNAIVLCMMCAKAHIEIKQMTGEEIRVGRPSDGQLRELIELGSTEEQIISAVQAADRFFGFEPRRSTIEEE